MYLFVYGRMYAYLPSYESTAKIIQYCNLLLLKLYRSAVAHWLRCCATNRKVVGSIPDGVIVLWELVQSFFSLIFAVVLAAAAAAAVAVVVVLVVVVRVVVVIIYCISITTNTHRHRYLTFLTQLDLPIYHFICFAYHRSVTVLL